MRIRPFKRRRGSVALEAVAAVPFALMMIFLARFIAVSMLTRHEVAVYTRGSASAAAAIHATNPLACDFDTTDLQSGQNVNRTSGVTCKFRDAEAGLNQERNFEDSMASGAQAFAAMIRDVRKLANARDMMANGTGSAAFDRPDFLSQRGAQGTSGMFLLPTDQLWTHLEQGWANGHDKAVWAELKKRPTQKLFPNVFPARNN